MHAIAFKSNFAWINRATLINFVLWYNQFKEIGEDARNKGPVDAGKPVVQSNEKKKGFDWMFAKPVDEVKDHWVS